MRNGQMQSGKDVSNWLGDHDSLVLDKVASTTCSMGIPSQKNLIKRSSLRNHMLAEDDVKNERK
ncbi:hypothetical protein RYX36_027735 [Vicia faba]